MQYCKAIILQLKINKLKKILEGKKKDLSMKKTYELVWFFLRSFQILGYHLSGVGQKGRMAAGS